MPILVDNSQSMRLKTASDDQTRHDRVLALVPRNHRGGCDLLKPLTFARTRLTPGSRAWMIFRRLQADGYVSSMAGSLRSLAERFADRPVAGAILFTDGNLTDAPAADFDWSTLGFPIYPVLPENRRRGSRPANRGRQRPTNRLRVRTDDGQRLVRRRRHARQKVFVQLKDIATGKVVEEQTVRIVEIRRATGSSLSFSTREESGVSFFTAPSLPRQDREQIENPSDA